MTIGIGGPNDPKALNADDPASSISLLKLIAERSGGGGAVTEADGANVVLGSVADLAVITDAPGTLSAKARGKIVLLLSVLARLPAALTGSGNLKTALQEALPAGSNVIGGVTLADGADAALGGQAATPATTDTGTNSLLALFKRHLTKMTALALQLPAALGQQTRAASLSVTQASDATGANAPETKLTNGTNILDVINGGTGQNAGLIAGTSKTVTESTTIVAAICAVDAKNYSWVSLQMTSAGVGATASPQVSLDGTNWLGLNVAAVNVANVAVSGTLTTGTIYAGALPAGAQFRVNVTGILSGTTTVVAAFSATPRQMPAASVSIAQFAGQNMSVPADSKSQATSLAVVQQLHNGSTTDVIRGVTTFKSATASASGDNLLWTPAAGKKFRLMGYQVEVTGDSTIAVAGVITLTFRDGTNAINITHSAYLPSVSLNAFAANTYQNPPLSNGILSAAANNVLNLNLSVALTAGTIRVNVYGTEE